MVMQISPQQAKVMLDEDGAIVLDVREESAFLESHIPNARHVGADNIDSVCDGFDRRQALIVYCYHGISSLSAAKYLEDQGYQNLYSIEGGFEAWRQSFPVET